MSRPTKYCSVPQCTNSSKANPTKHFFHVPSNVEKRKLWFEAVGLGLSHGFYFSSNLYYCEDHFNLEEDVKNFLQVKLGFAKHLLLKDTAVPSQKSSKRFKGADCSPGPSNPSSSGIVAGLTKLVDKATATEPMVGMDKFTQSDKVHFRSKGIQFKPAAKNVRLSPLKAGSTFISTGTSQKQAIAIWRSKSDSNVYSELKGSDSDVYSELKGSDSDVYSELKGSDSDVYSELEGSDSDVYSELKGSDSDASARHDPLSSDYVVKSSSPFFDSESSEVKKQKVIRKETVLKTRLEVITARSMLYLGIPPQCYFIINLINKHTTIAIPHILLCLKKIRLDNSFLELADDFVISESYASKIFLKNIPIISSVLRPFIVKLDRAQIKKNLPISFRHNFFNLTCIIDCLEITIQKPTKALNQALTWSEYKKSNTAKYLISYTPNGLINFISEGFGGRTSDMCIVEQSSFLNCLQSGDMVLADRGFEHIKPMLVQMGVQLLRPQSVAAGCKLSKNEDRTKTIVSVTIHVERVIRRVREFHMLKPHSVININLLPVLDDILVIVSALINLQDSIIK